MEFLGQPYQCGVILHRGRLLHEILHRFHADTATVVDAEPDALRDRYGRTTFGQSCLLARRLVEAGTRFVQVNWTRFANSDRHSWDCHKDLPKRMRDDAAPKLDPALATLLEDLRGIDR